MFCYLCFLLLLAGGVWSALPGNLKACKMGSEEYSDCLAAQINTAIKFFKNGNKKLGVSPIDPFRFTTMTVDQSTGPVAIKLQFENLDMIGLSAIEVKEVTNDWKTLVLKAHLPHLDAIGDYSINGKVMVLPIQGKGKCKIVTTDVSVISTFTFSEYEKGGKKHFKVEDISVDITPKKTTFDFQNLFNGDKALGDNMNLFLNENHEQILNELKPAVDRGMSAGFTQLANQILSKINSDEIKK